MSDHFSPHPLCAHEQPSDSGAATITGDGQPGESRPLRRTETALQGLSPGYFPFVMATSIISTGMSLLGPSWRSRTLLVIASAAIAVLIVATVLQLVLFPPNVAAAFRAPERVFGYFAVAAGLDVLGIRLAAAGHPLATAILAGAAAAVWFVLTYGIPARLLLGRSRDSVLGGVNGTWLLWVVATQSLSTAASTLVPVWPSQSGLLAPVAVGLWSVGLVLAGARILELPAALAVVKASAGFVEGFSFTLWAFGTWWIPLLVVLGFWRHIRRHWPLSYDPALWSVVFPLGMYSVATLTFGKVARIAFMAPLSRCMLWVALAAWLAVAAAFVVRLWRAARSAPAAGRR
jgi:tellurite resistance protein TehA-like permease